MPSTIGYVTMDITIMFYLWDQLTLIQKLEGELLLCFPKRIIEQTASVIKQDIPRLLAYV